MSAKARGWRRCGCYVWRARKPTAFIGLPFIGRHFAYVGETSSRWHRDQQHLAKVWADLDVKVYPLWCPFPHVRWVRKSMEWIYIKTLFPVYNVQHNGTNPRRITPATATGQRAMRNNGMRVAFGRAVARFALGFTVLAGVAYSLCTYHS